MHRVAIIGASGYTGAELLRLCAGHPELEVAVATGDSMAGTAIGWLATGVLLAAGFVLGFSTPTGAEKAVASETQLAGVAVQDVRARWIENATAGRLGVVSGVLRNASPRSVAPGALLTVRVLDAEGRVLLSEAARVAPGLPSEALRAETPENTDYFERHIRPALAEHCYECHSQDARKLKGGLRLDTTTCSKKLESTHWRVRVKRVEKNTRYQIVESSN